MGLRLPSVYPSRPATNDPMQWGRPNRAQIYDFNDPRPERNYVVLAAFVAVDNDVVVFIVVEADEKIGRGFQTLNFEAQVMSGPGFETED